jgi:hypothetical protein
MTEAIRNNAVFLFPTLVLLLSIPLALKLIPPNHYYGMRIPKTYSSPQLWYAGNRICGLYMAYASLLALSLAIVLTWAGISRGAATGLVFATVGFGVFATVLRVRAL